MAALHCWCGMDMRYRKEFGLWQCRRTYNARDLLDHPMRRGPDDQVDHDPGDEDRRPDFEHGMRSPA